MREVLTHSHIIAFVCVLFLVYVACLDASVGW